LYQDEKFQSLKQSIYKSRLLKLILLYVDEPDESDSFNINKQISERFPNVDNIFGVTEEQEDRISKINNRIKSNFCIPNIGEITSSSNLIRTMGLPNNYTLREE
jgi:hypothetical protein